MNYSKLVFIALLHCFVALSAQAKTATIELDEVIVSAPSGDGTLKTTPHSVTVITSEDIEKAGSSSVVDLLSRQANINLQSFFGSDKNATIDMRGMGDTAGSNVLIMVDGVRRNEMDLSGADLTTIPLSQIERIEIVRGGGSVLYGNGAVGGVINIITKRGKSGVQSLSVEATRGSYGLQDSRLNATGAAGPFIASVNASKMDTDGFRLNGGLRSDNASAEIRFLPTGKLDFLDVYASIMTHYDAYGLPGPVSAQDFAGTRSQRRSTNSPNDNGTTDEKNFVYGVNLDFDSLGELKLQSSLRHRVNDYVIGYNPLLTIEDQASQIDSFSRNYRLQYDNAFNFFDVKEKLTVGMDKLDGDYTRWENGRNINGSSLRKNGNVYSTGNFSNLTIQPIANLTLTGGYRENRFNTLMTDELYGCINSPVPPFPVISCNYNMQNSHGGQWRNYGAEWGITWQPSESWTIFTSSTKHFRNPNIDELALASNDLRPQKGQTVELGIRYSPNQDVLISGTLFKMKNKDEIYFDSRSGLGINRNYEIPTIRKGAEAEVRWKPFAPLSLQANVGYVLPRFEGTNADIPLVPRKTMSVRAEWEVLPNLMWSVTGRYAGSSFDGNDFYNTLYPKVAAYTLYDTALRYQFNKIEMIAGINNIFNEVYTTRAYSETYYPMPDRNGFVRLKLKF